jgi:hypothetical protein
MTIFRPANPNQLITIIARYIVGSVTLTLKNKGNKTYQVFNDLPTTIVNGFMTVVITKKVFEGESFEIEIKDGQYILFRGIAFSTNQIDLENYKINT